ncbi:MAG: glycosyltransferase family 2 protein [Bacillota bacterium]
MRIAAIIPAYNEQDTVGAVVDAVVQSSVCHEIIVVSDGSTDLTPERAASRGARVIRLEHNLGKAAAMEKGVESTDCPVLLFLDGDLVGLTPEHVRQLVRPVVEGEAAMSVGVFSGGRLTTDLAQHIAPFLSGQRALRRQMFEHIKELDVTGFGVEVALTQYARKAGLSVKQVVLPNLTHVMKEEKRGLISGFLYRLRMYWDILCTLCGKRSVLARRR